jgi:hypothetical protein
VTERGDARFIALDRAGIEAAPPQHAGDCLANKLARIAWAVLARGRA